MDHFSPSYFALLGPLDQTELARQIIPDSILRFLSTLSAADVRYLLCGDMALTLYGVPGRPADLDLLVDPEEDNVQLFIETVEAEQLDAGGDFTLDELRENKKAFRANLHFPVGSGPQLRVLFNTSLPYGEIFERRTTIFLESLVIHLLSLEDLMMVGELMEK